MGNSNFPASKYYREADADDENAFYPMGFEGRENSKYLKLDNTSSTFQKLIRRKAFKALLLISFLVAILAIVSILLNTVLSQSKYFWFICLLLLLILIKICFFKNLLQRVM